MATTLKEFTERANVIDAYIGGAQIICSPKGKNRWRECDPGRDWDWVHYDYKVQE